MHPHLDVIRLVADVLGVRPSAVYPDASLVDDLAVSSLQRMEILFAIEDELRVFIAEEEALSLRTVAELGARVRRGQRASGIFKVATIDLRGRPPLPPGNMG